MTTYTTRRIHDMTTRTDDLLTLMDEHKLTVKAVGLLLDRKPQTVRIWRCKNNKRQIPKHALELLQEKVKQP